MSNACIFVSDPNKVVCGLPVAKRTFCQTHWVTVNEAAAKKKEAAAKKNEAAAAAPTTASWCSKTYPAPAGSTGFVPCGKTPVSKTNLCQRCTDKEHAKASNRAAALATSLEIMSLATTSTTDQ
jgi:hypothetical protein